MPAHKRKLAWWMKILLQISVELQRSAETIH